MNALPDQVEWPATPFAAPETTSAMPDERDRDAGNAAPADALVTARPPDDLDEGRRSGNEQCGIARARARHAFHPQNLIEPIAEHAERQHAEYVAPTWQRLAAHEKDGPEHGEREDIRTLLNASGANTLVANFTTMKLTPQMRAMQSRRRSVAEIPAGTLCARSGVSAYVVEAIP